MPQASFEEEVAPIRGDIFLDRILGWLCLVCALAVLGLAVYRLARPGDPDLYGVEPTWVQPVKVVLIVFGIVGLAGIISSRPGGFRLALWLHAFRLAALIAMYPYSGGIRFWSTEFVWNLVVIGYAWLRIRSTQK
jgi:hypothetical protein